MKIMHIRKNIMKIPFWGYYFLQDVWIKKRLKKINCENEDFQNDADHMLKGLLSYAYKAFPAYYHKYQIDKDADISQYPILSKRDYQKNPDIFVSKYKKFLVTDKTVTSGSTGEPFAFEVTPNHDPVHQKMLWDLMGYQDGDQIVLINGKVMDEKKVKNHIYYVKREEKNKLYGDYMISCLYLTDQTAPYYFEFLKKVKPDYIKGYTYAVFRLAQYAEAHGIKLEHPIKGIQLTSEMVLDYQIPIIERAFNTKVYMQYGQAEAGMFAYTYDDTHKYKCSPVYGYMEVLDKNGKHVKEGETGEAVVTSFSNYVMPFIRYRTGDLVEYGGKKNGIVILNRVIGRTQDIVYNKDKEGISLTDYITNTAYSHMLKWRIVQKEYGKITFQIVKGPGYSEKDEEEFREVYEKNGKMEIEFQYVDDLGLSKKGKSIFLDQYLEP